MSVRYRLMQQKDVGKCVEHIAAHPILGPRYGKLIERLPPALRFALANTVTWFPVLEETQGSVTRFLGAGMAVFVFDEFLSEAKTAPMFWVGPELVKRITSEKSPLLSPAEVRDANSASGLNLLIWHVAFHPRDILVGDVGMTVMAAFVQHHRGLRLREVFGQADCVEHYDGMRNGGGMYFDRARGSYANYPDLNARNFSDEPRNCGLTRDLAFTQATSWLASLFVSYAPPRLGLSQSEQRMLRAARGGETDEELADLLGISIYAVKIKWRMIYERAAACLPDLFGDSAGLNGEEHHRGKEKKQHLLDYVRKHPEELHPISRKLLQQGTAKTKSPRPGLVL